MWAFTALDHHRRFLQPKQADQSSDKDSNIESKRGSTPNLSYETPRLIFTLTEETFFDANRGLYFGSDDEKVDVVLDKDNQRGVSGRHFAVRHTWEHNPDPLLLIIRNLSGNGTWVGDELLTGGSSRIIPINERIQVKAGMAVIKLQVIKPASSSQKRSLQQGWSALRKSVNDAVPRIVELNIAPPKRRFGPTPNLVLHTAQGSLGSHKHDSRPIKVAHVLS